MENSLRRFAPLAGIVFPALVVVGFAIEGSTPGVGDPAEEIAQFYSDNDVQVILGSALAAWGAIALLLFGAGLGGRLRDAGSNLYAALAFGGAVVASAGMGVDSALRFALARAADDVSPEATQALFAAWDGFFWPMHLGIAVLVAATSLAAFESRILPVAVAGLGLLAAVLVILPVLPVMLVGLIAGMIWLVVASIVLFRQPATATG